MIPARISAFLLLLFCSLSIQLAAAPLDAEIQGIFNSGPSARAHWGVYAVRVSDELLLADVEGSKLFVPASNRKLVTSALVVRNLGEDKVLQTVVHAASKPNDGVISGDLVIKASGDPSWMAALRGGRPGRSVLNAIARQLAEQGIATIEGNVVIDASRYIEPAPMPPGWDWEDLQTIYGSIPSVFGIDSNLAAVLIRPGKSGEPVTIEFPSAGIPFELVNEATTGANGSAPTFLLSRGLDGTVLHARGRLAADSGEARRSMAVGRPVEFAGAELVDALADQGIHVRGALRVSRESIPQGEILAVVSSATVPEMLSAMNHPSDNFLAESLFLLAGAERFGRGSYEASSKAEQQYWTSIGVSSSEYLSTDGSGLSRRNFITPHALCALLLDLHETQYFVDSLPVSGKSGTLRYRLAENGLAGRVRAKTGTLTGVSALSGYVTASSGHTVAFSIIVNNYASSAYSIRQDIDRIVEVIARRG